MIRAEMALSNSTITSVANTLDTRTVDIDTKTLGKKGSIVICNDSGCSSKLPETWAKLNDTSTVKTEEEGAGSEHSGSVTSELTPTRRQYSRRNSNDSVYSAGSAGSSGSKNSAKRKTTTKRRSWKKPKDKPKRPLSAYNIFFKHTRSRIVEGLPAEGSNVETIASIEGIVANSTETRKHRKTHGQISFGDLARTIAEKWKTIDKNNRALFDHYAALDMTRYRREVAIWKAKKESEALAGSSHSRRPVSSLDISASSGCTSGSMNFMTESQATIGVGENYDDWNTPQCRAFSASFNTVDSDEGCGLEPIPLGDMPGPQSNMIGLSISSLTERNLTMNNPNIMMAANNMGINPGNVYNNIPSNSNSDNSDLQNQRLQDMWMKNRELEESINKLKKELSQSASLGGTNSNNVSRSNMSNSSMNASFHSDFQPNNQKNLNASFPVGPSIDRMQDFHRRRMMMGDLLSTMTNDQNLQNNHQRPNRNIIHSSSDVEEAFTPCNMQLEPYDINPVPIDEVFSAAGAEAKKNELVTNLGHLDFFGANGGRSC